MVWGCPWSVGWGGVVLGWVALWGVIGGDLVTWFFYVFYVVVWCVRGVLPPLKLGVYSLVLNAFGIDIFGILSQKEQENVLN